MLGMYPLLLLNKMLFPGFIRDTWFKAEKTGIYRGQCAELCGKQHAYMPIVVEVVTEDQFNQWVLDNQTTKTTKLNINE